MKQSTKYHIGVACGCAVLLGGIIWSSATGEGANIGAGGVQLVGLAAILSFGIPLLVNRTSRRKK